jgi:hypothetical protein
MKIEPYYSNQKQEKTKYADDSIITRGIDGFGISVNGFSIGKNSPHQIKISPGDILGLSDGREFLVEDIFFQEKEP